MSVEQSPFVLGLVGENGELLLDEPVQVTRGSKTKDRHLFLFSGVLVFAKVKYEVKSRPDSNRAAAASSFFFCQIEKLSLAQFCFYIILEKKYSKVKTITTLTTMCQSPGGILPTFSWKNGESERGSRSKCSVFLDWLL